MKYIFNIEGIELQKLGVPQQPGKRYRNRVSDFDDRLMLTATGLWNFYLEAA